MCGTGHILGLSPISDPLRTDARKSTHGALALRQPAHRSVPGNIAELDLKATQSGKKRGLLANTQETFRLNTVGGVAPAGGCEQGAVVGVPYGADYVFIQNQPLLNWACGASPTGWGRRRVLLSSHSSTPSCSRGLTLLFARFGQMESVEQRHPDQPRR
ncbi:DUF3455 domain-containing protein [Streptomyces sp. SLBN-118]|uniref:DUF3455 domain-containing protein n=1 Tax=Streptomyces sp. SLBN-118 TaxID=2768454 RepID=UPI0021B1D4AD|nr:DUF3455 domain-containing protein [Streptomyces sp. SLBN-118]